MGKLSSCSASLVETLRVLVLSRRPSSVRLHEVLGFRPRVRQNVAEDWQVLEALADGWWNLVVAELSGSSIHGLQLVAMVRTAGRPTPFVLVADHVDDGLRAQVARLEGVELVERNARLAPRFTPRPVSR